MECSVTMETYSHTFYLKYAKRVKDNTGMDGNKKALGKKSI